MPVLTATPFLPRFLACLPKGIEPRLVDERKERALRLIKAKLSIEADVVPSGAWFKQTFIQSGNYSGWIHDCVHGRSSATSSPNFVGFVVFNRTVGKATAEILGSAVSAGRAVLLIDDEHINTIVGVERNDNESWAFGWTVQTKETI